MCIGLEAILGDDKLKEGITKSLADRCAYLLCPTAKSRKERRELFEQLYDHRSKLVHGRRTKLGEDAEVSLFLGRRILKEILKKELRNFEPEEGETTCMLVLTSRVLPMLPGVTHF